MLGSGRFWVGVGVGAAGVIVFQHYRARGKK